MASVEVGPRGLDVRFGVWRVRTPLHNVAGAEVTGPYQPWKVAGGAHRSFADGGATFATTARRGVCIRFKEPVPALLPFGLLPSPALTVTVRDVDGLVEALTGAD